MMVAEPDVLEQFPECRDRPNSPEFDRGFEKMVALLKNVLHGKGLPMEAAEDEAMEIAVKLAVTQPEGFRRRAGASFHYFLFRVAINRANDWWRAHAREPEPLADNAPAVTGLRAESARTPRQQEVAAAMNELSEDDRRVLEMRVVAGLQHEEIAEVLGITAEASRVRFHRAKERLRKVFLNQEKARSSRARKD